MNKKRGLLIVISGPSGVGKDTLVKEYLKHNDAVLSVSATSRKIRGKEKDGVDYYFLTKEEFEEKIKNNEFLEYAVYNDCYYGTPRSEIEDKLNDGKDIFLVIEVQGAFQIKEKLKDSILIFLLPPSLDVLEERLRNRASDSEEMIQNRLKIAIKEIKESTKFDYIITNNDVNNAIEKIKLILDSEREKR